MPQHAQLTTDQTFTGKLHLEPETDSTDLFSVRSNGAGFPFFNLDSTTGYTLIANLDVQSLNCLSGDLCIWASDTDAQVGIYDRTGSNGANLDANSLTDTRTFTFPDATGTIALANNTPTISTGTAAPETTPGKVGDIYIDTTNHKLYFADGTTNSSNWVIAN